MSKRATSLLARAGVAGATFTTVMALGLLGAWGRPATANPNPPASPAPQGGFGTIKGRLVWGGDKAPDPKQVASDAVKKDPVCAKIPHVDRDLVVDPSTLGIANGFAYLPLPKGKNEEALKALLKEKPQVVIDQVDCEYIPYSTAAHKDQEFVFKSSDATGHNVHYTGFVNSANFALAPKGSATKKLTPEKRQINLVCDIHGWMRGSIMVFDHPFFAVTGEDGSFEIKGVPAGKQKIVLWQKKVGFVTEGRASGMEVVVEDGKTTDIGAIKLDPSMVK